MSRQLHLSCRRDMTYNFSEKKPLLHYSENEERASFFDTEELAEGRRQRQQQRSPSMPRKKKSGSTKKVGKRRFQSLKGVKFSKGRLALHLKGYKGVQKLAPAQLVRYIPLTKLKQAARKVLSKFGEKKVRKRKGKKKGKRAKKLF